ncbi:MAG: hypothetical protein ACYC4L_20100 [Chloroflexota bacterium]
MANGDGRVTVSQHLATPATLEQPRSPGAFSPALMIALALIVVVRLVLVSGRGIQAIGGSQYDDELFLRLADGLLAGEWLGDYHERTLAKGAMYPLFVAANYVAGLPLLFTQHLLYLVTGLLLIVALASVVRNRVFLVALYAFYAFCPSLVGGDLQRATRDVLHAVLTVSVFAGLIGLFTRGGERQGGVFRWAIVLGFSFSAFWLTREEGVWLLPSAGLLLAATTWLLIRQWLRSRAGWWRVLSLVLAVGIFLGSIGSVAAINQSNYGVFLTNEFREGPFPAAYGALSRVEHPQWKQYVPVPRAVFAAVYEQSPAFRELQPHLDGSQGKAWGEIGCNALPQTCGEIAGGWFMWALRDAAMKAGHYSSAGEAAAYWQRLAGEVNQACREGRLACGGERASMDPPLRAEYFSQLPRMMLTATDYLTGYASLTVEPQLSAGSQSSLPFYEALTRNPLNPYGSQDSATFSGWAYRPGAELSIKIEGSAGGSPPGTVTQRPSPDIATHFGDAAAANARFEAICTGPCTVVFSSGGRLLGTLRLLDKMPVLRVQDEALTVYLESVQSLRLEGPDPLPAGSAVDATKARILTLVLDFYRLVTPALSALALLAYLLVAGLSVAKRTVTPLFVVNTALLGALMVRILLLSLVAVTSFPGISSLYLSPAYPMLLLFIGLASFDGAREARGALSSAKRRLSSRSRPTATSGGAQA